MIPSIPRADPPPKRTPQEGIDWAARDSLMVFFILVRLAVVLPWYIAALTGILVFEGALLMMVLAFLVFELVYRLSGDFDVIMYRKWPWAVWLFTKFDKRSAKYLLTGELP